MTWHLLTGEYPPDTGGVGDYARLLAEALAAAGHAVHVWTPSAADAPLSPGVEVHGTGGFHGDALGALDDTLDRHPTPRRLLVQYAPQAFGRRGMNVAFCRWLLARRRKGDGVRVMFHEPYFPFGWRRPWRNALAAVNRVMARLLLRASTRAYLSTAAWEPLLRPLAPRGLPIVTLPIPSTIPRVSDPVRLYDLRGELTRGGTRPLVAHFGTYGELIAPGLMDAIGVLWARVPDARVLLLGEGGAAFAERFVGDHPGWRDALVAPGWLPPEEVSLYLQSADAALQPYPDGADTRRTTLMAALANGVPTATTRGRFTEPVWAASPVPLAPAGDAAALAEVAADLLARRGERDELGRATRAFYERSFAMERTVERLLADAGEGGG